MEEDHQAPITEEVEVFEKIGDKQSNIQSQMHFEYDSAKSIALYAQKASKKPDAMVVQERGKCIIQSS